ncbi:hypothetical protein B0T16DRAFT_187931 [Cercophora newfieldiana]|uniref:Uncharacterized protein n=1 Tax=Cercophora newfieldiana TaxID=92897 RepID=A0AA40CNN9_9PEZI|nr:hypothetical protein B0T16DRAFT_187931 [Cercophora newfieldiana]
MSSNNSQTPSSNTTPQQPGLMASHAEYIKGAAETTIGNLTGSHAWTTSGEQDKAHAKAAMKAATENRDPAASGYGKAEELAGKLTGCEGMRQEGAASAAKRD